jgi:hypothetical protein
VERPSYRCGERHRWPLLTLAIHERPKTATCCGSCSEDDRYFEQNDPANRPRAMRDRFARLGRVSRCFVWIRFYAPIVAGGGKADQSGSDTVWPSGR